MLSCEMWQQAAQSSIQELRQMVFDMDSDVKSGTDRRSSHEQDFRKLGFQVLLSVFINVFIAANPEVAGSNPAHCSLSAVGEEVTG